jgi:hypothetical protein
MAERIKVGFIRRKEMVPLTDTPELFEVKKAREVKGAFVKLLEHHDELQPLLFRLLKRTSKYWPSHGIDHSHSVAKIALHKAIEGGVKDKAALQDVVIASLMHDMTRQTYNISGEADAAESAKLAFIKLKGILPEDRRERVRMMIVHQHKLSKYLDYADFIELGRIWRSIVMGRGEIEKGHKIPHEVAVKLMEETYDRKLGYLSDDLKLMEAAKAQLPKETLQKRMALDKEFFEKGLTDDFITNAIHHERRMSARVLWSFLQLHPELENEMPRIFGSVASPRDLEKHLLGLGRYDEVEKGIKRRKSSR